MEPITIYVSKTPENIFDTNSHFTDEIQGSLLGHPYKNKEKQINPCEKCSIFYTITDALNHAKNYVGSDVQIHIGPGVYKEKIEILQERITFIGSDTSTTIITYDLYAKEIMYDGEKRGTFRSMSVYINAAKFCAKNITFENSSGNGDIVGQALAIYVDSDDCSFENCRFLGSQDTLFTGPLPPYAKEKNGFRGPKEYAPRTNTRQYYKNCYIEGGIDFIFGSATAFFDHCELFCKNENKDINSYVTAASTPENQPFGYVFSECRFTSNCKPASCYLGRPWREFAKVVILNSEIGEHIHPEGFHDWGKTTAHDTFFFAEYHNYGKGADISNRASFVKQLTDEEALLYSKENVLKPIFPSI